MKSSAEVLSADTNCPVIQMSNRSYPGILIQGDTLRSLYTRTKRALEAINPSTEQSAYNACEFVVDSLEAFLSVYENTLHEKGIELPYVK